MSTLDALGLVVCVAGVFAHIEEPQRKNDPGPALPSLTLVEAYAEATRDKLLCAAYYDACAECLDDSENPEQADYSYASSVLVAEAEAMSRSAGMSEPALLAEGITAQQTLHDVVNEDCSGMSAARVKYDDWCEWVSDNPSEHLQSRLRRARK